MIHQMNSLSDTIYAHCLNVALISRMIGRWLHLEQHDLDILTCSGLLHDIGKLAITDEVLNKPGNKCNHYCHINLAPEAVALTLIKAAKSAHKLHHVICHAGNSHAKKRC